MRPDDAARFKASDKSVDSFPHLTLSKNAKGAVNPTTKSEMQTMWTLVGDGHRVTRQPESVIKNQQTADFLIDGKAIELWTPSQSPSMESLAAGIENKVGQGGARSVIADTSRYPKITAADAERAARSVANKFTGSKPTIRIIGQDFDLELSKDGKITNNLETSDAR